MDEPVGRCALPMNTQNELVPPSAPKRTIHGECKKSFMPDRMFISAADIGGGGTAANWEIDDIRVDGVSIRKDDNGPLSGALWSTSAEFGSDSMRVQWRRCERDVEIDVRYVGKTPGGTPFYGSVLGSQL